MTFKIAESSPSELNFRNIAIFLVAGFVLLLVLHFLLANDIGSKGLIYILVLSASLFVVLNFQATYLLLLFVLFLPYMYVVHQSVYVSIFLLLVALITFRDIRYSELKNPILTSLFVYSLACLPSFINTSALELSLRDSVNIVALFSTFIATLIGVKDKKTMMRIFYIYIIFVFFHSLHVIYLGVTTDKRAFGILNVYYIDFAGLGSVMTFVLVIFNRGFKRFLFLVAFIIITLGLIFTQTRNAWLSTVFATGTLVFYLFFNSDKTKISRVSLGLLIVVIVGMLSVFMLTSNFNLGERLDVGNQTVVLTDDPESVGTNSFVSRVLIWHTAVMAFLQHPYIGIGAYSFRHSSQLYYTIPKSFYTIFVEKKTPHLTYLQVLTETGILGLIAFLIFIWTLVRYSIRAVKAFSLPEDAAVTIISVWSLVYIVFSMAMTESWLYCQYIVWLGILLGMVVNIRKRLESF